jgi:hypothetical protein
MIRFAKYLIIFYFTFQILMYLFIWSFAKIQFNNEYSYLYFNEGWIPQDEPTGIFCSDSLLRIRPDRVFFYFVVGSLFQRPGEIPIYFGILHKKAAYYWSFRNFKFIAANPNGEALGLNNIHSCSDNSEKG